MRGCAARRNPFMREGQPVLSPARPRRDAAVAGEELALRLEEPGELDLVDVGKRPLEHAWSLSAGDLRRERQEELIGEAALAEPAVQGRASLAENRADPALGEQPLERTVELDPLGMADQGHRRRRLGRLLLRGGEDDDKAAAVAEQLRVPGDVE